MNVGCIHRAVVGRSPENPSYSDIETGKDIMHLDAKADHFTLGNALLPYTTRSDYHYINRSRKEGLIGMGGGGEV
jgi:hypothetical protein